MPRVEARIHDLQVPLNRRSQEAVLSSYEEINVYSDEMCRITFTLHVHGLSFMSRGGGGGDGVKGDEVGKPVTTVPVLVWFHL